MSNIHRQLFEITFAGTTGALSYNHDNDIFYRFKENGFFGWGLIATLNERAIDCFDEPYILDLGCADGFYYRRFLSHKKGLKYIGCNLDKKSVCKAQRYMETHEGDASFLCLDFVNNMPIPAQTDSFTNVFWYASMHMFEDETQKCILKNIKFRLGNNGILSGSVSIKNTGWKYCINAMNNEEELFDLLNRYFNHVWVYHDRDMASEVYFMASQKELPMMKYYC